MVRQDNAMAQMSQHVAATEGTDTATHRPTGARAGLDRSDRGILSRTVIEDVIPRLAALPWMRVVQDALAAESVPESEQVQHLLTLCLDPEPLGVPAYIAELNRAGVKAERIYLDLLTPVARELGQRWVDDECSFADVTIGVMRLQNAQRALTPAFLRESSEALEGPRVLLLPVPGEQHTFGLSMVMDFFRRAGWDSHLTVVGTNAEAIALVRRERADMVGLSFACDERIETAARLIADFRQVAANPHLRVIVGGPSFVEDPGLAERIGADGTAQDGHQAVLLAHSLLHVAAART